MAERSKLALNNEDLIAAFFSNTRLLGIVAPENDYRFCWHLNFTIGLDFRMKNDYEPALLRKNRTYYFSIFEYEEPTRFLSHYVYNNRYDGEYLLPEFRNIDFLWLLKGDDAEEEPLDPIMQSIRRIPSVQLVTELTLDQVKNKGNMIF